MEIVTITTATPSLLTAVHIDETHIKAPIDSSLVSETQRPSAMQDFVLWVLMFCWKINSINNEPWGKCQVLAFLNVTPSFQFLLLIYILNKIEGQYKLKLLFLKKELAFVCLFVFALKKINSCFNVLQALGKLQR